MFLIRFAVYKILYFRHKKSGYLSHFLTIVYSKLHTCLLIVNQTLESILNLRFLVKPSPD